MAGIRDFLFGSGPLKQAAGASPPAKPPAPSANLPIAAEAEKVAKQKRKQPPPAAPTKGYKQLVAPKSTSKPR